MATMNTKSIPFNNMSQCFEAWKKTNEKGITILSNVNLNNIKDNTLKELDIVLIDMRKALQAMHELYDKVDKENEKITLYKQCVNMFEQEYMVKESIRSVVRESGFMSKQQLTGSIALWKAEAYLDDDVLKQLS
ncbi:unnamed protein product [Cunninghamella echinulata]